MKLLEKILIYEKDKTCEELKTVKNKLKDVKKTIVLIGDGTKVAFNKLKDVLPNITVATASVVYQSAADVCVLAAEKVSVEDFKLTMAHDVLPNYLRLSQAERELKKKDNN